MRILHGLSRREVLALTGLPAAGILGWLLRRFVNDWPDASVDDSDVELPAILLPEAADLDRLRRLADAIAPLFSKLRAPQSDDWLAKHFEIGQTFAQFLATHPHKLSDRYRRIRIAPLGELTKTQSQLVEDTAEYLQWFFGLPVETLDPVHLGEVPDDAQRVRELGARQVWTRYLMNEVLLPLRDDDTAAVFGFTTRDLWDGDFGFLFGQGSPSERVCVGSVARFGDVDSGEVEYPTCLRRIVGLAVHEIGHVFRLPHCIAYSCRMKGSNHLAESDRRPLEFCPECLPKIWWT